MSSARVRATDRTRTGKLIAFLSIAALSVMPIVGYLIWSGYQAEIHDAETTTRDYAAILEARLEATLRRADAGLRELAHTIPAAALSQQAVPRYARELNAALDLHLFNFNEIAGLHVADRYGDTLYTSASASTPRVHVSARSDFRLLRDNPQAGLVFSEVITDRSTNRQVLAIARALTDARGNFVGLVYALLELEQFQALLQSLAIGPQGVISFRRSDDRRLVLRWPHLASMVNQPLNPQNPIAKRMATGDRAATLQFAAQIDGVERIFSYQALEHYPFYVTASLGRDNVLAEWRTRSLTIGASTLLLLGLLAWLLFRLWRAAAREARVSDVLKESDERNRTLLAVSPDGIWIHNNARIEYVNDALVNMLGYDGAQEFVGREIYEFFVPEFRAALRERVAQVVTTLARAPLTETAMLRHDGSRLEVETTATAFRQGDVVWNVSIIRDITERKRAEQALRDGAEELRLFTDNVPAITVSWDENLRCRFANKAFAAVFGLTVEDVTGKHLRELYGEEVYREVEGHFMRALQGHPVTYQRTHKLANGEPCYLEVKLLPHIGERGQVLGCFAVTTDITEHKLAEERIQRMAHHDSLTGLPNRLLFNDRLDQAISLAKRDSRQLALLYLDLDRFKPVNDTLGHTAGDELLQAVAVRIRHQVRESDTVARVGGDEFTVILPDIAKCEEAETVAMKIIAALAAPFQLGSQKQSVDIGASIGIAVYPTDGLDADALIKAADAAMYSAKQAGSSYRFCAA
ncbi:MAG TPA: diguanylate cyclase [Burkholderiales bacterium]